MTRAGRGDGRRTRAFAKVTALLVSVGVALAGAEATLRYTMLWHARPAPALYVGERETRPSRNFVPDAATGWRMRAEHAFRWTIDGAEHAYRSNDEGFRTDSPGAALRAAETLVVLVGDSFAFGTGVSVEETFGERLAEALAPLAVYNLAMPGFGVDQMALAVRHQALPMRPSALVVAFIDEDFERSLTAYRETEGFAKPTFVVADGSLRAQTSADRPTAAVRWLEANSAVLTVWQSFARTQLGRRFGFGEWFETNAKLFATIADDAARAGVPLLFVRLPQRPAHAFPALQGALARLGASYLDLGAPGAAPPGLHFERDAHISAAGHAFVAERLVAWVGANAAGRRPGGEAP